MLRSELAVRRAAVASRLNRRPGIRPGVDWLVPAGIAAVFVLGMVAYGFGAGRVTLLIVAADGCISCLAAYIAVGRLMPRYYAPRLLIVGYGLQLLALFAIAALGLPLSPAYHPFDVNVADAPFRAVLAMLTVPAGALMAALAWWTVSRSSRLPEKVGPLDDISKRRRVYLVVAAVVLLLYWPAALENSGAIGYVGRILATALMIAPFLAGHDSRADRRLAALWSVAILVNAVVGIVAGTRQMAFIAALLFGAGYISALPRGRRLVVGACAGLAMVPLIQLAGALGVLRDEVGRGGLELLRPDHAQEVFDGILRQMTPSDQQNSEEVTRQGVARLLAWTNVVVPIMTPETIPYRGFDGFLDEAIQTLRIARVSGLTVDDLLDAGLATAPARVYGFSVNANTSVEFTLAADGWSRGGAPVALLFSFIAALGLTVGELCAFRLHPYGTGVATILVLPVAKAALFDANFLPFLPTLRGMVIYTLTVAVLVVIIELVRHTAHNVGRRRLASPPGWARVGYRRG